MKKYLLLVVLVVMALPNFAQKNLLKLGGLPSIDPFEITIGLFGEIAYERVLTPRNSVQISFNVRPSADLGSDGGGHFAQMLILQYRYYFSNPKVEVQRGAYIAAALCQNYFHDGATYWYSGGSYDWGGGIGGEVGKHFRLGKYGVSNLYLGIYVSGMRLNKIVRGILDSDEMIYYNPPIVTTGYYTRPTLRLGYNWGIAWGKQKKTEKA